MRYDGADLFSPDTLFTIRDPAVLTTYLGTINELLLAKGYAPLILSQISSGTNQLKARVDLCHVYGIGVAFDLVYILRYRATVP